MSNKQEKEAMETTNIDNNSCVNVLYCFVPFLGINRSIIFLIGFILYNFSCHGFWELFILVDVVSFTFLTFYNGKLGLIMQILIVVMTFICYLLVRKVKDTTLLGATS